MLMDTQTVNAWYVLHKGFKIYSVCPACQGPNIAYHKVREAGYAGILSKCVDCHKVMPVRMKALKLSAELKAVI